MKIFACLAPFLALIAAVSIHAEEAPTKNRLRLETSAYLQMHAENPVDWYPWGEDALARAKKENKPIFVSIGYASCHWCHVMEKESFSDPKIAAFLNEHFVCVKVDREERPDVDAVYMLAVQVMSRSGGWPLNVFLTPDGKPFFGTTYLPPEDREVELPDNQGVGLVPGFLTLAKRIAQVWQTEPQQLHDAGDSITRALKQVMGRPLLPPALAEKDSILRTFDEQLEDEFDARFGGFDFDENNPNIAKFPQPSYLTYLARRQAWGDAAAGNMLKLTLEKMAAGGIHDQVAGGFHRYSTDRHWQIPHFEKMLYDNAQLLPIYAAASVSLDEPKFAAVARDVADFVLAEMTGPEGQFYSALDADSDGEEGAYYRFTPEELQKELTADQLRLAEQAFGMSGQPNFDDKYYVPQFHGAPEADKLAQLKASLLAIRKQRNRPFLDQKVITSWNGLMITGLARAGETLHEPRYTAAAAKAADHLLKTARTKEGRLLRTPDTKAEHPSAYLDDYAMLIEGLLALHQATGEQRWLDEAVALQAIQEQHFGDEAGGYFFTPDDNSNLIVRGKLFSDSALPSGNAVAVGNLKTFAKLVPAEAEKYNTLAEKTIEASAQLLNTHPNSTARMAAELVRPE
ncbi:thioredoxin domain-containing protein [Bremerella cremea]|uniref:Thioredoxin domain-containing protein n=1 Tax=Bremerella cremea TaxID=1031537 RepID=A0A368KSP7_9BACT|nr:thioredoxin domain-containing protein [Bremerella cremea]RCS52656.1 thioredoxin domain-containing protein [Bremerella cremea]